MVAVAHSNVGELMELISVLAVSPTEHTITKIQLGVDHIRHNTIDLRTRWVLQSHQDRITNEFSGHGAEWEVLAV